MQSVTEQQPTMDELVDALMAGGEARAEAVRLVRRERRRNGMAHARCWIANRLMTLLATVALVLFGWMAPLYYMSGGSADDASFVSLAVALAWGFFVLYLATNSKPLNELVERFRDRERALRADSVTLSELVRYAAWLDSKDASPAQARARAVMAFGWEYPDRRVPATR